MPFACTHDILPGRMIHRNVIGRHSSLNYCCRRLGLDVCVHAAAALIETTARDRRFDGGNPPQSWFHRGIKVVNCCCTRWPDRTDKEASKQAGDENLPSGFPHCSSFPLRSTGNSNLCSVNSPRAPRATTRSSGGVNGSASTKLEPKRSPMRDALSDAESGTR